MENAVNREKKQREREMIAKASDEPENNKRIYEIACNSPRSLNKLKTKEKKKAEYSI